LADDPAELVEQPRLADPRLADDADDLPVARPRRAETCPQQIQLLAASPEPRALPLAAESRASPSGEAIHRAPLRHAVGREIEATRQERRGRRADENALGLGALDHLVEHGPLRPLRVGVDRRADARLADQHVADVDGDLDGEALAVPALTTPGRA